MTYLYAYLFIAFIVTAAALARRVRRFDPVNWTIVLAAIAYGLLWPLWAAHSVALRMPEPFWRVLDRLLDWLERRRK